MSEIGLSSKKAIRGEKSVHFEDRKLKSFQQHAPLQSRHQGNVPRRDSIVPPAPARRLNSIMPQPHSVGKQSQQNEKKSNELTEKSLNMMYSNKRTSISTVLNTANNVRKKGGFETMINPFKNEGETAHNRDGTGIRRRWSTINLYSNRDVMDTLFNIQEQQKRRKQDQLNFELQNIQKRIKKTLENIGMESDSEEEDEDGHSPVKLPPIFDTRAEREKIKERNYILGKVDSFDEKALVRKQYLTEVAFWFEDNLNMCSEMVTPTELKESVAMAQEMHAIISKSLVKFITNGDKVVETGKALLVETGKIIEEKRAQMAKKTKKERIIVYDDKAMLSDPIKWESAAKTIISVLEDCQKMIRNVMFKNALRLGQKQFDYMMVAADRRYKDLDEKKRQCTELQGKLHMAKMQADKMNKEIEEQKRKMNKLTNEMTDTKNSLEKVKERNKELNQKVTELTSKIKFLEQELRKKLRTPTPPPTPPPPPEPEKVIVKVVDSATELRLQEVEEELEVAKDEIEKLLQELEKVNEALKTEQDKTKLLQERVTDLENVETLEPVIVQPVNSPAVEIPAPGEISDKDANYYKTLMAGMKNDFAAEMEKVKAHVKKEKNRGDAGVRKLELQHKDQLAGIQKDTLRMLRAIAHYRDHMIGMLQKENLIDQAQALHELGDIIKDKASPDPKELLATIVGTVVDYLHNMEEILSNSFLALKVLMKYQVDRQVEHEVQLRAAKEKHERETKKVVKECQKKTKSLKGAKQDVGHLAKRLKKAKNKMKKYEQSLENVTTDKKYADLLQRYNQVINLYKNMQKEMELLQSDFQDTMQRKLEEKETMMISSMKMEIQQEKVVNEEQLKMPVTDQKENLKLLSKAYEENKISKELHLTATAMIRKTMEIPRSKLQNLIEQYITYRTVQDSKDRVKQVLQDEETVLATDTRREMEQYLEQMEGRFSTSMKQWRKKMRALEMEKKEMNRQIYKLFNEVLLETGVLLVHPLLKDRNKGDILTHAATTMTRKQVQTLLRKRRGLKNLLRMPDSLQGSAIPLQHNRDRTWQHAIPPPPAEPGPGIVAPHMLAYEVNRPQIQATRFLKDKRGSRVSLCKTESFNINTYNYLQFIRDVPFQRKDHKIAI